MAAEPDEREGLEGIRERHAVAIAGRKPGAVDSRDDDIADLLRMVDRLSAEARQPAAGTPNS